MSLKNDNNKNKQTNTKTKQKQTRHERDQQPLSLVTQQTPKPHTHVTKTNGSKKKQEEIESKLLWICIRFDRIRRKRIPIPLQQHTMDRPERDCCCCATASSSSSSGSGSSFSSCQSMNRCQCYSSRCCSLSATSASSSWSSSSRCMTKVVVGFSNHHPLPISLLVNKFPLVFTFILILLITTTTTTHATTTTTNTTGTPPSSSSSTTNIFHRNQILIAIQNLPPLSQSKIPPKLQIQASFWFPRRNPYRSKMDLSSPEKENVEETFQQQDATTSTTVLSATEQRIILDQIQQNPIVVRTILRSMEQIICQEMEDFVFTVESDVVQPTTTTTTTIYNTTTAANASNGSGTIYIDWGLEYETEKNTNVVDVCQYIREKNIVAATTATESNPIDSNEDITNTIMINDQPMEEPSIVYRTPSLNITAIRQAGYIWTIWTLEYDIYQVGDIYIYEALMNQPELLWTKYSSNNNNNNNTTTTTNNEGNGIQLLEIRNAALQAMQYVVQLATDVNIMEGKLDEIIKMQQQQSKLIANESRMGTSTKLPNDAIVYSSPVGKEIMVWELAWEDYMTKYTYTARSGLYPMRLSGMILFVLNGIIYLSLYWLARNRRNAITTTTTRLQQQQQYSRSSTTTNAIHQTSKSNQNGTGRRTVISTNRSRKASNNHHNNYSTTSAMAQYGYCGNAGDTTITGTSCNNNNTNALLQLVHPKNVDEMLQQSAVGTILSQPPPPQYEDNDNDANTYLHNGTYPPSYPIPTIPSTTKLMTTTSTTKQYRSNQNLKWKNPV